jgi:serine/threonine protein kinase
MRPEANADPFRLLGTTLAGRYAVQAVAGQGPSSIVYRARHTSGRSSVAIKVLRDAAGAADAEAQEHRLRAFTQSGAAQAELSQHTSAIVQAYDTATLLAPSGARLPYLVLEWLDGEPLDQALRRERRAGLPPRSPEEAVALLDPIAVALSVAHARGLSHCALTPADVFVVGDPRDARSVVKLKGVGAAAWTSGARGAPVPRARIARTLVPAYAAPEQFSEAYGIEGPWTDVFALALIAVELVTGTAALHATSVDGFRDLATAPSLRPTPRALGVAVPDAVESALSRALALYPAERWQAAPTFWGALTEAVSPASRLLPAAGQLKVDRFWQGEARAAPEHAAR